MSGHLVLSTVSKKLQEILWEAYQDEPEILEFVSSDADIVLTNPTQTAQDSAKRLSLWLYQINENEFLKNQPPRRTNGHSTLHDAPLALNLFYLITPFAPSGELDHILLGKTMQVLYDNATIYLNDVDNNVFEELRIIFCRLSLEELTRIWEALREPYRLSVCYQVKVTSISSQQVMDKARVVEVSRDHGSVPDKSQRN